MVKSLIFISFIIPYIHFTLYSLSNPNSQIIVFILADNQPFSSKNILQDTIFHETIIKMREWMSKSPWGFISPLCEVRPHPKQFP